MSFDCIVVFFMAKPLWLRRDNNIFLAQWSKKSLSLPGTQQMLSPVLHTFPAVFLQTMNIDALRTKCVVGRSISSPGRACTPCTKAECLSAALDQFWPRALFCFHSVSMFSCLSLTVLSNRPHFHLVVKSDLSDPTKAKWPKIIFKKMCCKLHLNTGSLQQWTSDSRFSTETPQ